MFSLPHNSAIWYYIYTYERDASAHYNKIQYPVQLAYKGIIHPQEGIIKTMTTIKCDTTILQCVH